MVKFQHHGRKPDRETKTVWDNKCEKWREPLIAVINEGAGSKEGEILLMMKQGSASYAHAEGLQIQPWFVDLALGHTKHVGVLGHQTA